MNTEVQKILNVAATQINQAHITFCRMAVDHLDAEVSRILTAALREIAALISSGPQENVVAQNSKSD